MRIYTRDERLSRLIEDRRTLRCISKSADDPFKTRDFLRGDVENFEHPNFGGVR